MWESDRTYLDLSLSFYTMYASYQYILDTKCQLGTGTKNHRDEISSDALLSAVLYVELRGGVVGVAGSSNLYGRLQKQNES